MTEAALDINSQLNLPLGNYGDDEGLREKHQIALSVENMSKAEIMARLPQKDRNEFLSSLTPDEVELLLYDWSFWARPKQKIPVGNWFIWFILGGRGFGKTRTGAETIIEWQKQGYGLFALVGQTTADVRDVMLHGDSGLITCAPPWNKPKYISSRRQVEWNNGAKAILYSGDEPDQLRGPQHHKGWVDEPAKFKYLDELIDMLELGMRLGDKPQYVATGTPKPRKKLKEMLADEATHLTVGSSFENLSNLSEIFIKRVIKKYEKTRLGRQEIYAELFSDVAGALWSHDVIDRNRVSVKPEDLIRIVIAIDPSVTENARSDEAGIIGAGVNAEGHAFLFSDDSKKCHPSVWSSLAVNRYKKEQADLIVAETNNGGDLVEMVLQANGTKVNFKKVHAARGKRVRAEPIAALYEKGLVHHVGEFPELEAEYTEWVPGEESPNRLDAAVWCLTELMLDSDQPGELIPMKRFL
jgi:phage terminase large subunit-like protein